MKNCFRLFLFCFALSPFLATAQLSPGDLAEAHKELEGVFNCTKCHTLGDKVSNSKCLDCHKEINQRIEKKQGYHASKEVRGKDCFECHSDHHGRKFEMVRLDEDAFNHDWTGYKLTGAHKTTDCRACHQPDNIQESKYKGDATTFLGLGQDCIGCHVDVHQNTLSTNDCTKCHTTDAFSPAEKFDHSKTDFALFGKHAQVDCIECHKKETRNGKEFQRFTGIKSATCTDCHDDPHENNLGTDCKQCHTEKGWDNFIGKGRFDHNRTKFPLKGKHNAVNCADCHNFEATPKTIFQDRVGVAASECVTCHQDVHEGKFGQNCAECHTEQSWTIRGNPENFNHNLTDYPLLGKHQTVDCRQCHTADKLTDPVAHGFCLDCHTDFHEGQFAVGDNSNSGSKMIKNGIRDCGECHTVEGFESTTYGFEKHAKTNFPLEGAHIATPCFACHLPDDTKWTFTNMGTRCIDCHDDVHKDEISEKYYPNQECKTCHTTEAWTANDFDHSQTKFALSGVHKTTACAECHKKSEEHPAGEFLNLPQNCTSCHENVHGDQFLDKKGQITDCKKCHAFENWEAVNFDHSKTRFKLEGKHAEVECSACHTAGADEKVVYKIERFECVDCHGE